MQSMEEETEKEKRRKREGTQETLSKTRGCLTRKTSLKEEATKRKEYVEMDVCTEKARERPYHLLLLSHERRGETVMREERVTGRKKTHNNNT